MVCTDVIYLEQKLMKLIWLDDDGLLMAATRNGPGILLRVKSCVIPAEFGPKLCTLQLPVGSAMRWINASCLCSPAENSSSGLDPLLIVGTRDGGLYTFRINLKELHDATLKPVWSLEACHGRGGCTAVLCLPPSNASDNMSAEVISCGRTQGELRFWKVHLTSGSLVLRSLLPSSPSLTWVERFYAVDDGRLFVLGFQSVSIFSLLFKKFNHY
ncbi:unnamed protein product [Echinostoma caproni]|uniref:Uncharacterized protein n=1 Tax=Echinostoma caproni TaxID=27848 RepID=A0A3P8FEV7_9TREM|nr:unnamed protein product [Echinostoma caproni]